VKNHSVDKARLANVDLIKCIAIFFVISYHSSYYSYNIFEKNIITYMTYLYRTVVSTCVPVFFFVNGYLLLGKELDIRKHIKKIVHFTLVAEIWNFITLLIYSVIHQEKLFDVAFFQYLFFGRSGCTNHLWFIAAIIGIYIFFPLIKYIYDNSKLFMYLWWVCLILTIGNVVLNQAVTVVSYFLTQGNTVYNLNWFKAYNPFRNLHGYALTYFCLGGLINKLMDRLNQMTNVKRNVLATGILCVNCLLLWMTGILNTHISQNNWDVVWFGYDTVFTLVNVICLYVLCSNLKKDIFIIRSIADNTLGIYFIHENVRFILDRYVMNSKLTSTFPGHLLYALSILIISYLICLIMRHIPIVRRLIK